MMSYVAPSFVKQLKTIATEWHFHPMPDVLKVHQSVISYFQKMHLLAKEDDPTTRHKLATGATLSVDFLPSVTQERSARYGNRMIYNT